MRSISQSRLARRTLMPIALTEIVQIKDQSVLKVIELMNRKYREFDVVQQIAHYLEQVIQMDYFNQLKTNISEGDYFTVIEKLRAEYMQEGSIIIDKKKRNDFFYIILSGQVEILDEVNCKDGQQSAEKKFEVINKLSEGATFGQSSLISHRRQTSARVQAKTKVILLLIDYQTFARTSMKIIVLRKQEIANILHHSSIFSNIRINSVKDLAIEVREIKYRLNQLIYSPGSLHDNIYFVKSGIVEISLNSIKLMTLTSGQCFGVECMDFTQQSPLRCQQVKAKTTDVVIYKIPFSRLKVLKQDYDQLMNNIFSDYLKKQKIYQSLKHNYQKVSKLLTHSLTTSRRSFARQRFDTRKSQNIPDWWGTAIKDTQTKYIKYRAQSTEKQTRPNYLNQPGFKRIEQLKKLVIKHRSQPGERLSQTSYPKLIPSLSKRVLNKITNTQPQQIIRKKIGSKLKKQRLVNYAKSCGDGFELLFLS